MADEADCPVCGGAHPVTWLITHLNPAATIRSCEEDFEAAVLALLANRLEVDAGWLTDVINNAVDLVNRDITEAAGQLDGPPENEVADERDADERDGRQFETVEVEREVITTESGIQYLASPDE